MAVVRSFGVGLATTLLLLAVGCATMQVRREAARLESSGRVEAAWRLMREASSARPDDAREAFPEHLARFPAIARTPRRSD